MDASHIVPEGHDIAEVEYQMGKQIRVSMGLVTSTITTDQCMSGVSMMTAAGTGALRVWEY